MIVRPDGLDLRRSLRSALGEGNRTAVEEVAARQERTIDALLQRMYDDDSEKRREMVLLADEVGLGKTFVALGVAWSVLHRRREAGLPVGPVLVVTPHAHALFRKWLREAEQFVRLVTPKNMGVEVTAAETPHELAKALRPRRPTLVVARMSAFTGRIHDRRTADLAVLHWLLHQTGFELTLDERQSLVAHHKENGFASRGELDLRRSGAAWEGAEDSCFVGFTPSKIAGAWARLRQTDLWLCGQLEKSWERVRSGRPPMSSLWEDIREVCRAALGQTVPHKLPLVIVDEIHNWKNHPSSWRRFLHMLGLRVDRLLGLSATPFQLGPHELIQVLGLRCCLDLPPERRSALDVHVDKLELDLRVAGQAGDVLRGVWADVEVRDIDDLEAAWSDTTGRTAGALPPRLKQVLKAVRQVGNAHSQLGGSLGPFLLRHRRDVSYRAWYVGWEAGEKVSEQDSRGSTLRWQPGLDIRGDAELVHYLMMRAMQEEKGGRGSTSLGADLGGSYAFFREGELARLLPGHTPEAQSYLKLVERAVTGRSHEHPKIVATAGRAFSSWLSGEKTLVFCFNVATVGAVRKAVMQRIERHTTTVLTKAFNCTSKQLDVRLKNFQSRLYNYRQAMFLLFQDHPLAGQNGRLPRNMALVPRDLEQIAALLALTGPPRDRSRFDRRRMLAATEQVLVNKWQSTPRGRRWLDNVLASWCLAPTPEESVATILSSEWPSQRRDRVEGVQREAEIEPLPDDDDYGLTAQQAVPEDVVAWTEVLNGRAGRATLVPYLPDTGMEVPSLLSRYHAGALAGLPASLRGLAARMLRRMIRSPGFLARFLLDDPKGRPELDDDAADEGWTDLMHRRYRTPPAASESARDRFDAYLETVHKAVGLVEQVSAYEQASRNRDVVARVTGAVPSSERDRIFTGFNTPLVPEVLIVTSVGQEGIDLHRECRHVIHHDLPWNPATLEQRTGRVDRIGSKAERLRTNGGDETDSSLKVVVPYIAGTYDEHRFRVVHGRAHLFEVTMGAQYAVDGYRSIEDPMDAKRLKDDIGEGSTSVWAPMPEGIAADLRLRLDTEADSEEGADET